MPLAAGTRLGSYEILSLLGAGGMGEVYRGRDSRLGRDVAIKVLPADVARDRARLDRFRREAKTLAMLDHPNIVTVFSVEEATGPGQEGVHFLTMQLVEGQSLDHVIPVGGLTVDRFFQIASAIAEALTAAHDKSIVHRDLKPANVMVAGDGRVKVLDFGLAKDLAVSGPADATLTSAGHTEHGVVMGTPAYMSPEQVAGRAVDHRSDIFSLGILLYQMASGERPFAGASPAELASAILRDTPPLVTDLRTDLPDELARIIRRCLEKDPHQRIQTARDVSNECRALLGQHPPQATTRAVSRQASAGPRARSIAVLPFTNLGGDQEQEYFSEGLAEDIINSLAHVDGLRVAARTSAFSFKGKNVNVSTIAATLGVDSILEGSVRRSGHRLRVSVQLIDAGNGYQLWSERYDREMSDIFALQDDITLAVVAALKVRLLGDARSAVLKRYTDNAEAYELFLKGRYHSNKYTAHGWQRAMEYFEKAIAVEPDYALAYAGIATARVCQWFFGILPAEQTIPQCRASYTRALTMDEGLANALLAQGMVEFFYDWDWPRADQTLSKSITANPNDAFALSSCALFLAFAGRFDEATRMARQALAVDPLAPFVNMNVGWTFFSVGMLDEASRQAAKMIESDPDFYGAYWLQGAIHLCNGEFEQAVAQLRTAVSLGAHQVVVADLASSCALAGHTEEAATILNRLLDLRRQQYVPAIYLARVYSRIGETRMAVEWLETAFAERNGELVFLQGEIAGAAEGDSWRKLADEPRVMALLDSMDLP